MNKNRSHDFQTLEVLKQAPVAICIFKSKDYTLEFANNFYLNLFSKEESIIGKSVFESFPELIDQGLDTLIDSVVANQLPYFINEHEASILKNKKLEQHFFNCTYQPFQQQNGEFTSVIVVFNEVTKQVIARKKIHELISAKTKKLSAANKKLVFQNEVKEKRAQELAIANIELAHQNDEKEKRAEEKNALESFNMNIKLASQYARSLIEASLDPLIVINTAGKITDMNEATVKVTGVTRENLKNTDFKIYFTEPEKARLGYEEVFTKGFVTDYPLTILDHKLTEVLFNGSVYTDVKDNVLGVVVVARDITEQKRSENELIEARIFAELAVEIAQEAKREAESAAITAGVAVKSKQQFLSNMSHEIRTPMNAIIGFTKVLLKTELTAKQKEYLTAIKLSGDALIVLINDILDLAKVDAGKMSFEEIPFKLETSIFSMLHLFESKIQEKNLTLIKVYDNRIPKVLLGDSVRLNQIFLNLVSNAVKFTNKGHVTVNVQLINENNDSVNVEFSITDTGIGIPENKMVTIFENFQQASTGTSRLFGGTGLGLAIVKQLIEHQNGVLNVKSTVGKGSTFSFVLNFKKTNAEAVAESEILEVDKDTKDIKVLVVEDMPLNQLLMKTLLDDFGFDRDIAANGKIAIEKLEAKSYDIILMDLQMPEMNGFEATEYIRKTLHSNIPIIALTADVTTIDLEKCKSVGMNDYISKPVDERMLYSKIVNWVKKPVVIEAQNIASVQTPKVKCVDLNYLLQRTKSNPALMMEMINLYLEQTPPIIEAMKKSMIDKDWVLLQSSVHKIIPSFSIMGIHPDFELIAKKIQEYATSQIENSDISEMVQQLENVCMQACEELKEELNRLKNTK